MSAGAVYANLDEFYAADGIHNERRLSFECDFGVHWTNGSIEWPRYRVSYVEATGEVYAVALGYRGHDNVIVLGVVPSDGEGGLWYRTLDRILEGWADEPKRNLRWVTDRLAAAGVEVAS